MTTLSKPALLATLLLAALCLAAPEAAAQPNWRATPMFGTVSLTAGFTPDPYVVEVRAGGADANSVSGSGCSGYINNAKPDVDLNYQADGRTLYIYVRSNTDTTLLVNDPGGNWMCSDDYNGSNPGVVVNSPRSGNYNIWVGTFSSSNSGATANLHISELTPRF